VDEYNLRICGVQNKTKNWNDKSNFVVAIKLTHLQMYPFVLNCDARFNMLKRKEEKKGQNSQ